jgi:hypothetical protein
MGFLYSSKTPQHRTMRLKPLATSSTDNNWSRTFNGVPILEAFKGITPSGKCKNLTSKWNCSSTVRDRATDIIDYYWDVTHCLFNGKFGHVSSPLIPRKLRIWFTAECSLFPTIYAPYLMRTAVQSTCKTGLLFLHKKCLAKYFFLILKTQLKNSTGFKFGEAASVTTPSILRSTLQLNRVRPGHCYWPLLVSHIWTFK